MEKKINQSQKKNQITITISSLIKKQKDNHLQEEIRKIKNQNYQ